MEQTEVDALLKQLEEFTQQLAAMRAQMEWNFQTQTATISTLQTSVTLLASRLEQLEHRAREYQN